MYMMRPVDMWKQFRAVIPMTANAEFLCSEVWEIANELRAMLPLESERIIGETQEI